MQKTIQTQKQEINDYNNKIQDIDDQIRELKSFPGQNDKLKQLEAENSELKQELQSTNTKIEAYIQEVT